MARQRRHTATEETTGRPRPAAALTPAPADSASLSVGQSLAAARKACRMSQETAAMELKIRRSYVESMEADDWSALPGLTYALGFVRSYCDLLGMPSGPVLDRVRREYRPIAPKADFVIPENQPDDQKPKNPWILLIALLFLGGFIVYYNRTVRPADKEAAQAEDMAPAPEPLAIPEEYDDIPLPSAPEAMEERHAETAPIPQAPAPALPAAAVPAREREGRIVVKVLEKNNWVQIIRDGDQIPVMSEVLEAGTEYRVKPEEYGLKLDSGDIGGLEFWVDGKKLPPLGPKGAVIRGLSLDPEQLKKSGR
ncbi:XRE family transcriptional regulator [Alphaproteobacteria bacterium]|nr:XRE family transcriptional regulator [Alphaproteobacteria bacterium]